MRAINGGKAVGFQLRLCLYRPQILLCPRLLPFICPCPLQPLFLNHSIAIFNDVDSATHISVPRDAKMIGNEERKAARLRRVLQFARRHRKVYVYLGRLRPTAGTHVAKSSNQSVHDGSATFRDSTYKAGVHSLSFHKHFLLHF